MTGSASSGFAGRASKSRSTMRIATSGRTTITSRDLPATAPSAPFRAVRRAAASSTLGPFNPGAMAPSLRRRPVKTSRRACFSEARAAMMPSGVISQASRGRVIFCLELAILSRGLDKRDLVDLLHGGNARPYPGQRRITQKLHSFLMRRFADLRRWTLFQDQLANTVRKVQQLVDRGAPVIARSAALNAAPPLIEGNVAALFLIKGEIVQLLVCVMHLGLAVLADGPHQPLRQNAVQC